MELGVSRPDVALDRASLASSFGWASVAHITPVSGGAGRDAVLRIRGRDAAGRPLDAAIKVLHPETSAAPGTLDRVLEAEHAAWRAGVPMPEPLTAADGALFGRASVAGEARRVVAHRWVQGRPVAYGESYSLRRPAALGVARALARLHGLPAAPEPHLVRWQGDPVEAERWRELASALSGTHPDLGRRLAAEMPRLERAAELLRAAGEPEAVRLCHNDCAPHNGIRPVLGSQPVMLVDWDGACGASPRRELVATVSRWGDVPGSRHTLMRQMVTAYRDEGGTVSFGDLTDFSALVGGMVHWLENRVELAAGLSSDQRVAAAEAAQSVASMLDWLPELDRLEHLHRVLRDA